MANTCGHVIGVDVVEEKLRMARHNAGVYDVAAKVDFVCADVFQLAAKSDDPPRAAFFPEVVAEPR